MTQTLGVGVVGAGVGLQHLAAYRSLGELFAIEALCEIDDERAARAADEFGIPLTSSRFEDLLERDSIDVIDICTPPHLHLSQIERALAAGKHVVCEKPLVGSVAEADAVLRMEAASGRRVMPIFQYRFGHGLQKLRLLVDRGVAGRCFVTSVETAWRRGADYYAEPWRGRWETEMGGVLLSHAIHAHDLLCHVVGPIRSVFARCTTRVNPIETEDCATACLEMADGSLATLTATLGSSVEISRLRFCFEHLCAESSLAPYTPSFDPWTFSGMTPEDDEQIEATLRDFDPGPQWYAGQFSGLHDALVSGTELPVTLSDARASLELVTAMYHSSRSGEAVDLPISPGHPVYAGWLPAASQETGK